MVVTLERPQYFN